MRAPTPAVVSGCIGPSGRPSTSSTANTRTSPAVTTHEIVGSSSGSRLLVAIGRGGPSPGSSVTDASRPSVGAVTRPPPVAPSVRPPPVARSLGHQRGVEAALGQQLGMGPPLGHPAGVHDDDLVRVPDGGQPVGHDEAGAAAGPDVPVDLLLHHRVEGAGGLVE